MYLKTYLITSHGVLEVSKNYDVGGKNLVTLQTHVNFKNFWGECNSLYFFGSFSQTFIVRELVVII